MGPKLFKLPYKHSLDRRRCREQKSAKENKINRKAKARTVAKWSADLIAFFKDITQNNASFNSYCNPIIKLTHVIRCVFTKLYIYYCNPFRYLCSPRFWHFKWLIWLWHKWLLLKWDYWDLRMRFEKWENKNRFRHAWDVTLDQYIDNLIHDYISIEIL